MSITEPSRARIALILFASRFARKSYERFVIGLELKGTERVLDFGSGWGDNTKLIAERLDKGGRITALDVSRQWQAVIKERLGSLHNVDYVNSDIRDAGLEDGSFDVIVVSYVLHDIPKAERRSIVAEIGRKLGPGGRVELREPTKRSHGMPIDEIRELMRAAGLREIRSETAKYEFQGRFLR